MFGTDGIRGKANKYPMLPDIILKLGKAAALYFKTNSKSKTGRVIVGKDTRLSGYIFENAITAGLLAMGKEVFLLGPVPTPSLAFLTKSMRADFGIMITASHNPYYDNGIKIFDSDGFKLNHNKELEIESLIKSDLTNALTVADKVGRALRLRGVEGRYLQHAKSIFPREIDLSDLRIVVDCANGAAYKIAPDVLYELRAKEIITLGVTPNGTNINDNCGSTYINNTVNKVLEVGADVGISFDGDADRLIMVDEKGNVLDGDIILGIIANYWQEQGLLRGNAVVGTIVSSLGLERFLTSKGINLKRVNVGDKNIIDYMRKHNLNLGGEASGHTVLLDFNSNSDGILACLEVLKIMLIKGVSLSSLGALFKKVPQSVNNLEVPYDILSDEVVDNFISKIIENNKNKARIIVRKSGTENKVRILVEGDDIGYIRTLSEEINFYLKNYVMQLDK